MIIYLRTERGINDIAESVSEAIKKNGGKNIDSKCEDTNHRLGGQSYLADQTYSFGNFDLNGTSYSVGCVIPVVSNVGDVIVNDILSKTEVRLTHYIKFFTGKDGDAKDDISKWAPSNRQGEALLRYIKKVAHDVGCSWEIPEKEVGVLHHSLKGEYVRVIATGVTTE